MHATLWSRVAHRATMDPTAYDNFGCSHDTVFLQSLRPTILWYGIQEQAKCADAVCIHHCDDIDFVTGNLKSMEDELGLASGLPAPPSGASLSLDIAQGWNATAVGNLAYLALHAPAPDLRDRSARVWKTLVNQLRAMHDEEVPAPARHALAHAHLPPRQYSIWPRRKGGDQPTRLCTVM